MKNEKWYTNLTATDIVKEMSRIAHNTVACAKQGEKGISKDLHKLFMIKFDAVIPAIVDIKSEFYLHNKEVFAEWDKCQKDLWTIRNGMENDLMEIYL